jgi:3-(3-hydroxy-phenyl)propionate hydroxylase
MRWWRSSGGKSVCSWPGTPRTRCRLSPGQGLCAGLRGRAADVLLDIHADERERQLRTVVSHAKQVGLNIGELDFDAAQARDQRLGAELASGRSETIRQRFMPGLATAPNAGDSENRAAPSAGELFVRRWVRYHGQDWRRLDDALGARLDRVTPSADLTVARRGDLAKQRRALNGTGAVIAPPDALAAEAPVLRERDGLFFDPWLQQQRGLAVKLRPGGWVHAVVGAGAGLPRVIGQRLAAVSASSSIPWASEFET